MSYLNLLQILTLDNIYYFKLALFIHKIKNDPTNNIIFWISYISFWGP